MFEQALAARSVRTHAAWSVPVSFGGQIVLICLAVLLPLVWTDKLPRGQLARVYFVAPSPPPPPPPAPPGPKVAVAKRPMQIRQSAAGVVFLPARIPAKPAMIVDDPAPSIQSDEGGVIGGVEGGERGGILGGILRPSGSPAVVPAPPQPQVVKATPAPAPRAPVRVSNLDPAALIHQVTPAYPPLARQARISGTVRLEAIVGKDGRMRSLRVVSGHPLLARAALEAVQQWIYRPTRLNGEPVEVSAPIEVHFVLQ